MRSQPPFSCSVSSFLDFKWQRHSSRF